ncbi:MAG: MmgE/PrpD family protein, partial [Caldimonas sp.]
MTVARAWAAYCGDVASAPLPASVQARARLCVADHLHAAMHGARSDTATMLHRYFGWEESVRAAAAGAESAALYAGAISAVHEIDDVHQDTSLHPGSVVVAAAIASAGETDVP